MVNGVAQVRKDVWRQFAIRDRKKIITEKMVKKIVEDSCGKYNVPINAFLRHLESKLPFWERIDASSRRHNLSKYCTLAILNAENIFAACRPQEQL